VVETHVSTEKQIQKANTNHLVTNLLSSTRIIDVGELRISRATLSPKSGERYLIYLPMNRNYLWRALHDTNIKVRVYIEIPEGVLKKVSQGDIQMK